MGLRRRLEENFEHYDTHLNIVSYVSSACLSLYPYLIFDVVSKRLCQSFLPDPVAETS